MAFKINGGPNAQYKVLSLENPHEAREAIRQAKKAAQSGQIEAYYFIGQAYEWGKGIPKDRNEAYKAYKAGYDLGHGDCAAGLGSMEMNNPKPDYAKAKQYFEFASDHGSAEGANYLGMLYHFGNGVPRDENISYKLSKKAVEMGSTFACLNLGNKLRDGLGCEQNYAEAFKYMKKASDGGFPQATNNLAVFYEKGWGIPVNEKEAFRLYSKAAESGMAESIFNLAAKYREGCGCHKDVQQAIRMYYKAAEQQFPKAYMEIARINLLGDDVPKNPREAVRLLRMGAQLGEPECAYHLGTCLREGNGVDKNFKEAMKWLTFSMQSGFTPAYSTIGMMYELAEGVERDIPRALNLYRTAAGLGNAYAASMLGGKYFVGQTGVDRDPKQAAHYLRMGAEGGIAECWGSLGLLYDKYPYFPNDKHEALECYRRGALAGHGRSAYEYGRKLQTGDGCQRDIKEAIRWYKVATENKVADAYNQLAMMYDVGDGVDRDQSKCVELLKKACEIGHDEAPFTLALKLFPVNRESAEGYIRTAVDKKDKRIRYFIRFDDPETDEMRAFVEECIKDKPELRSFYYQASDDEDEEEWDSDFEDDFSDESDVCGNYVSLGSQTQPLCQSHQFKKQFEIVFEQFPLDSFL